MQGEENIIGLHQEMYIFNVTPVNSNTVIHNDYILYRFINIL